MPLDPSAERRPTLSGDPHRVEAPAAPPIIGQSACTQDLLSEIDRVAPHDANVLVTGPSGTGKELVARRVHACSNRASGLFVPVDCASLTGELMAAQLFGHVEGAFTGATHATLGCFRAADRGTLFLDEIGEMPFELQAKLLRVIQEREVVPVGGHEPTRVDVRLVAATNRDLAAEIAAGRFREDLYYRLDVVHLQTTPLVERQTDIDLLAEHFLDQLASDGHPRSQLTPGALMALREFTWPGNVRQLRNVMEQASIEAECGVIGMPLIERLLAKSDAHHHTLHADSAHTEPASSESCMQETKADCDSGARPEADWETLDQHERTHLIATLERTYYNRSVAARLLGISRQTLLRRMEKHGIVVPQLPGMPGKE